MARYHVKYIDDLGWVIPLYDPPCTDVDCTRIHYDVTVDPRPADVDPADTVREVTG